MMIAYGAFGFATELSTLLAEAKESKISKFESRQMTSLKLLQIPLSEQIDWMYI